MVAIPSTRIASDAAGVLSHATIEKTLRDLWEDLEKENKTAAVQIRTLNLLVYLPANPSDEMRNRIQGVAVQHPGRTIIIQPEEGPPHADVSIACRAGSNVPCGEQIMLYGGDHNGEALLSLALSLLQPALPVALWWHGQPVFHDQPFTHLIEVADHVLVDSRTWSNPVGPLRELAELRNRYMGTMRFSDLEWVAITPWRQLLAQAFDSPAPRTMLPRVSSVMIGYGAAHHTVGAILLAGWLISRLGWEVGTEPAMRDEAGILLPLRGNGQTITLALRSQDRDGNISGIALIADGQQVSRIECEEQADALSVLTMIELPPAAPIKRVTPIRHLSTTVLIGEELAQNHDDRVYTAALDVAIALGEKVSGLL